MKTIIKICGKSVLLIIYWALVTLIVWVFYEDYISERNLSSIGYCVAYSSLGCALHGVFIAWLYRPELKLFEQKYPRIYRILYEVIEIISYLFLVLFCIALICAIVVPIIGVYALLILNALYHYWKFWFVLIILFLICFVLRIFNSPIFKAVSKIIYRISLVFSIISIIYIDVDIWSNPNQTDIEIDISVFLSILSVYLFYLLYRSIKKGILTFAKYKYVLFLRAFKDDDSVSSLYNQVSMSIKDIPLMKIGNPNKKESESIYEHWLPFSNWKFFLRFYIVRSSAIVAAISTTDGITWEIGHNMKCLNKFIIYYKSLNDLIEFKDRILSINNNKLDTIISSIETVIKKSHYGNSFVVQDNKIYIGEVCQLVNSVLKNDFTGVKNICITNIASNKIILKKNSTTTAIGDFLVRHFHVLNIVNSIEYFHNLTLSLSMKIIVTILGIVLWICVFFFGIGMTIFPFFIWFGHNFDWLGISYEDYSIFAKVLMSWFSISIGINLIRFLFGKDI